MTKVKRRRVRGVEGESGTCCDCDCQLCDLSARVIGSTDLKPNCWFSCSLAGCNFQTKSASSIENHVVENHLNGVRLKSQNGTGFANGRAIPGEAWWTGDKQNGVKTIRLLKKAKPENPAPEMKAQDEQIAWLFSNAAISISTLANTAQRHTGKKSSPDMTPGSLSILRGTAGVPYCELYPAFEEEGCEETREDEVDDGAFGDFEDADFGDDLYPDDEAEVANDGSLGDSEDTADNEEGAELDTFRGNLSNGEDGIHGNKERVTKSAPSRGVLKAGSFYVCIFPECGFSVDSQAALLLHEEKRHLEQILQAGNQDRSHLVQHPDGSWSCHDCPNSTFATKEDATSHLGLRHPPKDMTQVQCPSCQFSAQSSQSLLSHFKENHLPVPGGDRQKEGRGTPRSHDVKGEASEVVKSDRSFEARGGDRGAGAGRQKDRKARKKLKSDGIHKEFELCPDCGISMELTVTGTGAIRSDRGHGLWHHKPQTCIVCNYEAQGIFELAKHIEQDHPSPPSCDDCGFFLTDKELLLARRHNCPAKLGAGTPPEEAAATMRKFITTGEKLEKNLRATGPRNHNSTFVCLDCGLEIDSKEAGARHAWLMHTAHKCLFCKEEFRDRMSLKAHMDLAHPGICFLCCQAKSLSPHRCDPIPKHQLRRTASYRCPGLPTPYLPHFCQTPGCTLIRSMGIECVVCNRKRTKLQSGIFACRKCGVKFPNEKSLDQHALQGDCCSEISSFGNLCNICGKTMDTTRMKKHMRSHAELHCQKCDFVTRDSRAFHVHQQSQHRPVCDGCGLPIDTDETGIYNKGAEHECPARLGPGHAPPGAVKRPEAAKRRAVPRCIGILPDLRFVCLDCGLVFNSHAPSRVASLHVFLMHKRQSCPSCQETFHDRPSLVEHIRAVHPLTCINCSYRASSEEELKEHNCLLCLTAVDGGFLQKRFPTWLTWATCQDCNTLMNFGCWQRHKRLKRCKKIALE